MQDKGKELHIPGKNQQHLELTQDSYLIKSLRWDESCFIDEFIKSITQSPQQQYRPALRKGPHKPFTVYADGVYHRNNKPKHRYTDKKLKKRIKLSKQQSTSLVTKDAQCPVFGHNKERRDKLVGVMLDVSDAELNRMYIYDGGTLGRPYEHINKENADKYYARVTNKNNQILFDDIDEFKQAIARQNDKHNEVMARIRWNCSSSKIGIFSDSFESRCIALEYARRLRIRLQQQYLELGKELDDDYVIPIYFYLPGHERNLTEYTINEQRQDIGYANQILSDKKLRNEKLNNKDYEFLLIVDEEYAQDALNTIYTGEPIISKLLRKELFHIIDGLLQRAGTTLEDYVSSSSTTISVDLEFALYKAAEHNNLNYLNFLIASSFDDIDVNQRKGKNDETPLYIAAANGHNDIVNALIKAGAEVDKEISYGHYSATPLFVASELGHLDIVNSLIDAGAEVNKEISDNIHCGTTPLYIAAQNGHLGVVQALITAGANVDKDKAFHGETPLYIAAQNGHLDIVKTLINANADVNKPKRIGGFTSLWIAARQGHTDIVKELINANADLNEKNSSRKTPLDIATSRHHKDIVKILETAKIKLKLTYYINNRDSGDDYQPSIPIFSDSLKQKLTLFGKQINFSKDEKMNAAKALLDLLDNNETDITKLDAHKDALNQGELGNIFSSLKL